MKKLILSALAVMLLASPRVFALQANYTGDLINTAVCGDTTPALDLNAYTVGFLSFQTITSSQNYSATTFTDGRSSTGTITVLSTSTFAIRSATNSITLGTTASLAALKATDKITVASNTALSGAVLTFNGIQFIEGRDWTKQSTTSGTVVALKNLLSNYSSVALSTSSTAIFATSTVAGLIGNTYTLTSSTPAALTVLTPTFTGGIEQALKNSVLTFNGVGYLNGYLWQTTDTSSGTAVSLATLLNNIGGVACSTGGSGGLVVTCTATVAGTNSFTLTSSTPTAMAIGSPTFSGGRSTTTITINGVVLTNGPSWATGTTSSATAKNISDAIMANTSLNGLIQSTWTSGGIVSSTAIASGPGGNYAWSTNNTGALTLTNSGLVGGSAASWVVNTPTITVTNHGYSLGLGVLYSTGTTAITNLTNGTTYFVIPVDANNIKLATSKANALANSFVVLASSAANGQHTYTLTPAPLTGTASWAWQESNDNSNWQTMNISSASFVAPYTSTTTFWDFGNINARYLRLNVTSPTAGCVNLRAKGNGK